MSGFSSLSCQWLRLIRLITVFVYGHPSPDNVGSGLYSSHLSFCQHFTMITANQGTDRNMAEIYLGSVCLMKRNKLKHTIHQMIYDVLL